jgi:hypothetical protein
MAGCRAELTRRLTRAGAWSLGRWWRGGGLEVARGGGDGIKVASSCVDVNGPWRRQSGVEVPLAGRRRGGSAGVGVERMRPGSAWSGRDDVEVRGGSVEVAARRGGVEGPGRGGGVAAGSCLRVVCVCVVVSVCVRVLSVGDALLPSASDVALGIGAVCRVLDRQTIYVFLFKISYFHFKTLFSQKFL